MEGAGDYNPVGLIRDSYTLIQWIIVLFNEKVEGAGSYNPIGLIRDSYILIEKHIK